MTVGCGSSAGRWGGRGRGGRGGDMARGIDVGGAGGPCRRLAPGAREEVRRERPTGPCSVAPAHQTTGPGSVDFGAKSRSSTCTFGSHQGAPSRRGVWPHPVPSPWCWGPWALSPRLSSLSPTRLLSVFPDLKISLNCCLSSAALPLGHSTISQVPELSAWASGPSFACCWMMVL